MENFQDKYYLGEFNYTDRMECLFSGREKFYSVYYKSMDEELRKDYLELFGFVRKYNRISEILKSLADDQFMNSFKAKNRKKFNELDQLYKILNEEYIELYSKNDYSTENFLRMNSLLKKISDVSFERKNLYNMLVNYDETNISIENDFDILRKELDDLIEKIRYSLEKIKKLDVNGVKRLDEIALDPNFTDEFKDNLNSSNHVMEYYYGDFMRILFSTEKNAFSLIENIANEILKSYARHEMYDIGVKEEVIMEFCDTISYYGYVDLVPENFMRYNHSKDDYNIYYNISAIKEMFNFTFVDSNLNENEYEKLYSRVLSYLSNALIKGTGSLEEFMNYIQIKKDDMLKSNNTLEDNNQSRTM